MSGPPKWQFCSSCGNKCDLIDRFCNKCGDPLKGSITDAGPLCDDVRVEALEIGAELADVETFLALCHQEPNLALLKISKLERGASALGGTFLVLSFKFFALSCKALRTWELSGNENRKDVRTSCEESLRSYLLVREAARGENIGSEVKDLEPQLDEVAGLLEKCTPGKVQELLGETKLKYAAERVSILNVTRKSLTREDLREIFELPVSVPFIFRAVLLGSTNHILNSKRLNIMLYEQTDTWGPGDEMNPIKGQIVMRKDTPSSHWRVERVG